MACMANENSALDLVPPDTNNRKRCSLPGAVGSLHLYTTHQQRRLSERGPMVYRTSKPDIDLIGDFINSNKKSMSPASTSISSSVLGGSSSSSVNILPTIISPSRSPTMPTSRASFGSLGNSPVVAQKPTSSSSSSAGNSRATPVGCRKVRIRIQKSPGGKENKFVEMETIPTGSRTRFASVSVERDEGEMLLHHPMFDSRRFSDSVTCTPPKISVSLTAEGSDTGIICSTGDLRALKCLTSSAQEIRFSGPTTSMSRVYETGATSPDPHGNRSRSFDATSTVVTSRRKGIGTSWFTRRHVPISAKLPMSLKSPSAPNSPGPNQLTLKAPILTVTNEASGQSELIEVPSPPASTPPCGDISDDQTKVTWDQSGFQVDAAVLGSVIENHLRKTDMRRRATVSTLYEPPTSSDYFQSTQRARSASACVIPNVGTEGSESIFGPSRTGGSHTVTFLCTTLSSPLTTNRRSSLKMPWTSSGPRPASTGRLSFQANTASGEGEAMMVRKPMKRFSISGPSSSFGSGYSPMVPLPHVKLSSHQGQRDSESRQSIQSQSFVETRDETGRVNVVTKSSYSTPYSYVIPPINGRITTDDEEEEESRRRAAYYKKVNAQAQGGGTGISICSAIRNIFHSLRS